MHFDDQSFWSDWERRFVVCTDIEFGALKVVPLQLVTSTMDAAAALETFDMLEAEGASVPSFSFDSNGHSSSSDLEDISSSEEDKWENAFLGTDSDSDWDEDNSNPWTEGDGGDDGDDFNYDPLGGGSGRGRAAVRGRCHAAGGRRGIGGRDGETQEEEVGEEENEVRKVVAPDHRVDTLITVVVKLISFLAILTFYADADCPAQIRPFQPNKGHEVLQYLPTSIFLCPATVGSC